jgi:outer membrane protein TolC
MQIDVFALLTEARQRIAALRAAIEAKRNFWLAQSELQTAINGGGGGETQRESRPSITAQAGGGGH